MTKFKAIIKGTLREFEPHMVYSDYSAAECDYPGHVKHYLCDEIILLMGINIDGVTYYENDVFLNVHNGQYYRFVPHYFRFCFFPLTSMMHHPLEVGWDQEMKKIGTLFSLDPEILELAERYDPPVYSCLECIGKFSEVTK